MSITSAFCGDWAEALAFWEELDPTFVGHAPDPDIYWQEVLLTCSPQPIQAVVIQLSSPLEIATSVCLPIAQRPTYAYAISGEVFKGFHVALLNTRSMMKHGLEVADLVLERNFDLMAITESWYHEASNFAAQLATPPGFKLLRADRASGMGGGVAVFIRDIWASHIIPSEPIDNCEYILFKLALDPNTSLTCLLLYRPPPDLPSFKDQLLSLISSHLNSKSKFLILGDFNYWANDASDTEGAALLAAMEAMGFTQHIAQATHELGHTLDWVLTHNVEVAHTVVSPCGWSDHFLITVLLPLELLLAKTVFTRLILPRRNTKNIIPAHFMEALQPSLDKLLNLNNINTLASQLRELLNKTTDSFAPEKLKVVKPEVRHKGWFSDLILEARSAKRKTESAWRKNPSNVSKAAYQLAARQYKQSIVDAKAAFFNSRILTASSDAKELFRIVKEFEKPVFELETNTASEEWCQLVQDALFGKIEKHVKTIAARAKLLPPNTDRYVEELGKPRVNPVPSFSFRPVTVAEVTDTILKMKPTSYKGDACTAVLIQKSLDVLAPILTHLVNLSFKLSIVPVAFKESWITPLLKKSGLDPLDPLNYRPITNVSFILKILDKLAFIQIQEFLETFNLLNPRQSGFRRGFGTETALLDLKNCLIRIIDRGDPALLLLLDLSAAFDLVDHELLVKRLSLNFGFTDAAAGWVKSFLNERTARVSIGGVSAKPTPLSRGVPQGSCLSPTLYNMYTCPLFDALDREGVGFTNYADDTQIYLPLSGVYTTDSARIAQIYELIQKWMAINQLALNGGKTEILVLGTRAKTKALSSEYNSFIIEGCTIPSSSAVKTLGIELDMNLSMQKHALKIKSSCAYIIKLLKQMKPYISTLNMARVAGALINSRIDYCNSLMAGVDKKVINTLQVVQNNAVRAVTGTARRDHISEARRSLHWLPVASRIKHKLGTLTFKCMHALAPSYLTETITVHKSARALRSEGVCRLVPPRFKLATFGGRSFPVQSASLWNSLPAPLRALETTEAFRRGLKTHLFPGVT